MLRRRSLAGIACCALLMGAACDKGNPVENSVGDDNKLIEGTVTDIQGNLYKTVKIGNQEWTTENLRTTKYNDGTWVHLIARADLWEKDTNGGCCFRYDDADSMAKYGALYNWFAVDSKILAPKGWHVPTDADWTVLANYLIANGYNWDGTTTGNKIAKALATRSGWYPEKAAGAIGNNLTKNNRSGFSALPGGSRYDDGESFILSKVGEDGVWWTATESTPEEAIGRWLSCDGEELHRTNSSKKDGLAVRLVRD